MTNRNKTHTTCQCYHLTSFAVLMRVKDIRDKTVMVSESSKVQHVLYLSNDDYRQFPIFSGLTVIVNLDYSVPGLVVADEKKKSKSCIPGQDLNPEHPL